MKKALGILLLLLFIYPLIYSETIEKIIIEGNRKVSVDTVFFYIKSREHGVYSEELLREDFKVLWDTGFFEDISIEKESGSTGAIVRIKLKENLLIKSVTYKTGKKVKEKDITEKLQENNISLLAFSYYSPVKMRRIEKIIKDMLLEKGYNQGKVQVLTDIKSGQVDVTVKVMQGPKTRIGAVVFPGLEGEPVRSSFLRAGMKNNKVHNLLSLVGSKDVFTKEKISEDLEEVKLRLQQRGYLEAKVGQPEFSTIIKKNIFMKKMQMLQISIPIDLGPRYRMGTVKIEGNKVIKTQFLRGMVNLKKGKIYNIKKRNKIIEDIQKKVYGGLGYIYCQVVPIEDLDPVKKVADLTLRIHEGEVAYVGKLEFRGNTFTKDHVLRREWWLREGGRFALTSLEGCITRMKQLGLVTIEKMPEIKPDPKDPQKVDIMVDVKELNRQMINFNVGYSGYEGWFVMLGYSTQNFMGMGETLSLTLQTGTRSKQYRIAFTEPRLFNLPGSLGFSVHKTNLRYPGLYTRAGEGFSLTTSFRFWRYWGFSLSYSFENIEMSDVNESYTSYSPYYQYYFLEGKRRISAISPVIYRSTVDSPIFPRSGTKYLINYRYSGGFLGGDINLHKVKVQYVKFVPLWKRRHTLGMQMVFYGLEPFGGKPVPIYEKYFLGGEQNIRGFEIYRIGPKNAQGTVIGGTKAFHANVEYQIPLSEQISFNLFYDIGNTYDFGKPISLNDVYTSMGMEVKVYIPMLNVPFRLIFAYNPRLSREGESHFQFQIGMGPSFY